MSSYYTGSSFSGLHCPDETLFLACYAEKFWNAVLLVHFKFDIKWLWFNSSEG